MTTPSTPTTPPDDTLATEVFVDTTSPTDPPATAAATTPATPTDAATASAPTATQPAPPAEPTYLRGPAPFAIVLGLLGLLVAGATLLTELTDVSMPWTDLGPWSVVAAGLVVLVVGALGLRSSRTRD
jgi:hypothetical protein